MATTWNNLTCVLLALAGVVCAAPPASRVSNVSLGSDAIAAKRMRAPSSWRGAVEERWAPVARQAGGDEIAEQIVGGDLVTDISDFPAVVSLVQLEPTSQRYGSFCTGVLLDSDIVLTAAHCVYGVDVGPFLWFACAGTTDIFASADNCAMFESWVWPEAYDNTNFFLGNDVAVVKLQEPLLVGPVRRMRVSFEKPASGADAFAVGFGITSADQTATDGKMRSLGVNVVLNEGQCSFLTNQGLGNDPDLICADGLNDGTTCNGDSGSSLIVPGTETSEMYTVGVLSFGPRGCDTSSVSVYTSLYDADHAAFVRAAVSDLGGSLLEAVSTPAPTPDPEQPSGRSCGQSLVDCLTLEAVSCLQEPELTADCCRLSLPVVRCGVSVLRKCDSAATQSARRALQELRAACGPLI